MNSFLPQSAGTQPPDPRTVEGILLQLQKSLIKQRKAVTQYPL